MSTDTDAAEATAEPTAKKVRPRPAPLVQIIGRFVFIWVCAIFAFWSSLNNLFHQAMAGDLVGYALVIPLLGWLAMPGISRRRGLELPIHDRQTDMIVGFMGLVLSVLIQSILLQRYIRQYELLRLDLLAMWVFIVSSSVMLYGLRPVARFRWVWLMMLAVGPIFYHIMVVTLGGGRVAAGVVMLPVAAMATALAVGRTRRRALIGAALSVAAGGIVMFVIALVWRSAPVFVFQSVPAITATVLVAMSMFYGRRRRDPSARFFNTIPQLSAKDVWIGAATVLAAAVAISFVPIPRLFVIGFDHDRTTTFDRPLNIPADWKSGATIEYPFARRLFGPEADMFRQTITQRAGDLKWDKLSRPRTVEVDSVTTHRPNSFAVYRNNVVYDLSATRSSDEMPVDLGHGVHGALYSVVDDRKLLTWTAVSWIWANNHEAQRITIISVDNHEANAIFPQPAEALVSNLNTLFTILFRGNSAVDDQDPTLKDADLLTALARELIADQLAPDQRGLT